MKVTYILLVIFFVLISYSQQQNDSSQDGKKLIDSLKEFVMRIFINSLEEIISIAKVVRDFNNYEPKYLVLKEGDHVKVISKDDDIWFGKLDKQIGYFPKDFVEEVQQGTNVQETEDEELIDDSSFSTNNSATNIEEINNTLNLSESSNMDDGYQTDDGTIIETTTTTTFIETQIDSEVKLKTLKEEDEQILREIEEQLKYERERQEENMRIKRENEEREEAKELQSKIEQERLENEKLEEETRIRMEEEEKLRINKENEERTRRRIQEEQLRIEQEIEANTKREEEKRLKINELVNSRIQKKIEDRAHGEAIAERLEFEQDFKKKIKRERNEQHTRLDDDESSNDTHEIITLKIEQDEHNIEDVARSELDTQKFIEKNEPNHESVKAENDIEFDAKVDIPILEPIKVIEETQIPFSEDATNQVPYSVIREASSGEQVYQEPCNRTNQENSKLHKICADLSGLKAALLNIESFYEPFLFVFPESIHSVLVEPTYFLGLSSMSCSILIVTVLTFLLTLCLMARKTDENKLSKQINLSETIVKLELKMKNAKFERDTFEKKLSENESELIELRDRNLELNYKLNQIEEEFESNKTKLTKFIDKCSQLEAKNKELNDLKLQLECDLDYHKLEKDKNEKLMKENEQVKVDINLYHELQAKLENLRSEQSVREQQLEDYKKDALNFEVEIQRLKEELNLREKSIILLQNCVQTNGSQQQQQLPTINELNDENTQTHKTKSKKYSNKMLDELMDVAQLQSKIQTLEQQLQAYDVDLNVANTTKEKFESEIETIRKEYSQVKLQYDVSLSKVKELELKLKLVDELRKKDLELNVKACSELDAQLKKKSSDAEKSSHLLEQLKLKQERIQELDTQYARLERQSTQERQTFEKQAHENWLNARKFEKEAKEAKQEAKLWKEKFSEIEKYKENTLLRPVPMNVNVKMPYIISNENISSLNQTLPETADTSPPITKSFNESINTNGDRPPSVHSNGGYPTTQQLQSGISPTPIIYNNMPFNARLPFPPPMNPFMHRMSQFSADGRPSTTSPNPDLRNMAQYHFPMPPIMHPYPFMNSPGSFNNSLRQSSGTPLNTSMTQMSNQNNNEMNSQAFNNFTSNYQQQQQQQEQLESDNNKFDTNVSFNV